MIVEGLTTDQIARFPEYRQKWLDIGFNRSPLDLERAKIAVASIYKSANLPVPKFYFVMGSPYSAAIAEFYLLKIFSSIQTNQVRDQVSDQVRAEVRAQVSAQVWVEIRDQVRAEVSVQVWDQVRDQVSVQVSDQVSAQVSAQVRDQVRDQVSNQVSAQVWDQVRDQVRAQVSMDICSQLYGSHESWLSFYDYFLNECSLDFCKPLKGLIDLAHHCGWWNPFAGFVILQDRHCELHRDSEGRLHHSNEMCIKYRDGWGFYCLHGVRVPDWLVTTLTEEIDPHLLHTIDNAQVRAEFVRKVGIDRCFYKLGKVVDKAGNYELGMLELGDGRSRPYLKMLNPSVPELWHVEGVHPDCDTVEKALNWRNGTSKVPEVLT